MINPAALQLLATRVQSGSADGLQPFPSLHLPTAWLGSHHRVRLIESYAFHLQCMFLYSANYKRLFLFLSPSCSPASFQPLSAASEEKGNVDSIKEQGSHLLL